MYSKNHQIVQSVVHPHAGSLKALKLRSQEAVKMDKVQAIVTNLSISVKHLANDEHNLVVPAEFQDLANLRFLTLFNASASA